MTYTAKEKIYIKWKKGLITRKYSETYTTKDLQDSLGKPLINIIFNRVSYFNIFLKTTTRIDVILSIYS